jgi:hypothetical protein
MDFSTNKADRHDTTEILLKVALNNISYYNDKFLKDPYFIILKANIVH